MALFKKNKENRKKGAETTIGKIIYGFLLFMPLLSIGARCLYVIFNKNAYQSYSDTTSEIVYTQTNVNDLVFQKTYTFVKDETVTITGSLTINCDAIKLYQSNQNPIDVSNYHRIQIDGTRITLSQAGQATIYANYSTGYYRVDFVFNSIIANTSDITEGIYKQDIINNANSLDNVFEYSINQTQESNIYNWSKQTGTYTVLHNTTTGLGITNEFIPMLMAYWLIVSVIYFLFDIALILIWAVHKKIHELSEAI